MEILSQIVEPLSRVFSNSEVVLQDLAKLPNSIVAIAGNLTGREVGDPATDVLLKQAVKGEVRTNVNYRSQLSDGRQIRSTTIAIKDSSGQAIAALCINSDIDVWVKLDGVIQSMVAGTGASVDSIVTAEPEVVSSEAEAGDGIDSVQVAAVPTPDSEPEAESFVRNVEDLSGLILDRAIGAQGVSVNLMQKTHKISVIRQARDQGFFMLRDAVDTIAARLCISRFTVYNYLKEIDQEDSDVNTEQ
jgi:predicted transcriptional regulator YheO